MKNLFDLNARPDVIASHLCADTRFASVASACPGLRVPGAFDGFELSVRAILGQRVSVKAATTLAGRLASSFGEPIETPFPGLNRLSPSPQRLADAADSELTSLGISRPRAASIRAVAQAVAQRHIDLQPGPDPEAMTHALQEIPGIGDWTAQYIAMRALRWPDAFPAGDLGLLKASGDTQRAAPRHRRSLAALARLRSHVPVGKSASNSSGRTAMMASDCCTRQFTTTNPARSASCCLTSDGEALTGLHMALRRGKPAPCPQPEWQPG